MENDYKLDNIYLKEKCGVFGLYLDSNDQQLMGDYLYKGMLALQHRGQESSGFAVFDDSSKQVIVRKEMGLVNELFIKHMNEIPENASYGIAHVRYSTAGVSALHNAQPWQCNNTYLAFNGNISNYFLLKEKYAKKFSFQSDSDTEILANVIDDSIKSSNFDDKILFSNLKNYLRNFYGSYCITIIDSYAENGRLLVLRDQNGFRPLVLGKKGKSYAVASESCAITAIGFDLIGDIKPGSLLIIDKGHLKKYELAEEKIRKSFCMFEYVYFSRPDSIIMNKTVEVVRERLGKALGLLAKKKRIEFDIIVPIPDSGRSAAQGLAEFTKKPIKEALIKNRYVNRTFIMPSNEQRKKLISMKLFPIVELIKGKRIALVDDSIVRGNTMKKIVEMLRQAGAKEIHLFISCPKIVSPCFMGIDFPTFEELIAYRMDEKDIAKYLNVDSLTYMDINNLVKSIGLKKKELCLACLTGKYPIPIEKEVIEKAKCSSC
ncbi:MAG: amidophosphoribosyltransferase [Candidatus Micrarchaeota archaeon]|nr:amidophosphoribosyltransferase [Candidatus Micrarchaeota archaeon]